MGSDDRKFDPREKRGPGDTETAADAIFEQAQLAIYSDAKLAETMIEVIARDDLAKIADELEAVASVAHYAFKQAAGSVSPGTYLLMDEAIKALAKVMTGAAGRIRLQEAIGRHREYAHYDAINEAAACGDIEVGEEEVSRVA